MKRLHDNFVDNIDREVGLRNKTVLDIGCGNGSKSVALANVCAQLFAIDPDEAAIAVAKQEHNTANLTYSVGRAEELQFKDATFDVVIFSLSLHHVPIAKMQHAVQEAKRVLKRNGRVAFLEPGFTGSLFEAELLFDASDGDERKEKAAAYLTLLSSDLLTNEHEFYDEVTFVFDSEDDFVQIMEPKKNLDQIASFLQTNKNTLHAQRRINIFSFT